MRLVLIRFLPLQSGNIPKARSAYICLSKHLITIPINSSKALNQGTLWNVALREGFVRGDVDRQR